VTASSEVRLVSVTREQRDALATTHEVPTRMRNELASRADAVWTADDLPHLLDEPVERPSVSLRETIETLPGVLSATWGSRNGYDEIRKREFLTIVVHVDREMVEGRQVEREAEEGERDA
jgi:hypothetical protein